MAKSSVHNTWGAVTPTYATGRTFPDEPHLFETTLGVTTTRWNTIEKRQVSAAQKHDDLVTVLQARPVAGVVLTGSHGGSVKLWDADTDSQLAEIQLDLPPACFVTGGTWALNGSIVALVCQGPNPDPEEAASSTSSLSFLLGLAVNAAGTVCHEKWRVPLFPGCHKAVVSASADSFVVAEVSDASLAKAISRLRVCEAATGLVQQERVLTGPAAQLSAMAASGSLPRVAVLARSGTLHLFTLPALEPVGDLGASSVKAVTWAPCGAQLMAVTGAGPASVVAWFDGITGTLHRQTSIPAPLSGCVQLTGSDASGLWLSTRGECQHIPLSSPADPDLEKEEKHVVAAFPKTSLKHHRLTGCGVCISPDGSRVASGDFAGQVLVWTAEAAGPQHVFEVQQEVRALCWVSDRDLLAGTMAGCLQHLDLRSGKITCLDTFRGPVTALRRQPRQDNIRIALSSTTGEVHVVEVTAGKQDSLLPPASTRLLTWMAHPPQAADTKQNLLFGSLRSAADVWSLCFSPDGRHVCTVSEDQHARVWALAEDYTAATLVRVLPGHVLAATAVDWAELPDAHGTVLVTCSDDKTVRVYDGQTLALKHVFVSALPGWHTLTYLRILSESRLVVCTTQHGYVLAWQLDSASPDGGSLVYARKLHAGSIEGLAVHLPSGRLATVSSDNSVQQFSLKV